MAVSLIGLPRSDYEVLRYLATIRRISDREDFSTAGTIGQWHAARHGNG
jgi:hypothetical protein